MKVKVLFIVFKLPYLPVRVCQNCKDVFFRQKYFATAYRYIGKKKTVPGYLVSGHTGNPAFRLSAYPADRIYVRCIPTPNNFNCYFRLETGRPGPRCGCAVPRCAAPRSASWGWAESARQLWTGTGTVTCRPAGTIQLDCKMGNFKTF